jgi:predicted transcriptional regulator
MAAERANDLQAFRSFIHDQLANGETIPTVDEVLARWEYENENESENEREETLEAIRRGLANVEEGRVVPAREALVELRRKYNLLELL